MPRYVAPIELMFFTSYSGRPSIIKVCRLSSKEGSSKDYSCFTALTGAYSFFSKTLDAFLPTVGGISLLLLDITGGFSSDFFIVWASFYLDYCFSLIYETTLLAKFLLIFPFTGPKKSSPNMSSIFPRFLAIVSLTSATPSANSFSNKGNSLFKPSFILSGHSPPFYYDFCSVCLPIQFSRLLLMFGALSPSPSLTSSITSSIPMQ